MALYDGDTATAPPPAPAPPAQQPSPSPSPSPAPAEAPMSLRETLEKVVEANPIEAPEPDRETRQQNESKPSTNRRPDGKFAKRAPEGAEVPSPEQVEAATEPKQDVFAEEPENDETSQSPSIDGAPKSWKAGPKTKWATLDPEVRGEIHRREREASRAIADHAPVRKFVGEFQQVIQPHASRYAQSGVTPLQVINNLMQSDAILSSAPMAQRAQFMAKLISDYKIDINMLDAALSGGDPQGEPLHAVEQLLNQRLAPISEFVQSEQQRRQQVVQHEREQAYSTIEQMANDTKNYPHFDLVRQDMADVTELAMKRGVYLSPAQAYARAVAMNPEAQSAEQGVQGQQRAQVAHDAATRSLGASLSVSGSPAGMKQKVDPGDLRGTIEAAWEAAQGR